MKFTLLLAVSSLFFHSCQKKSTETAAGSSLKIVGKVSEAKQPESFLTTNLTAGSNNNPSDFATALNLVPLGKIDILCASVASESSCALSVKSTGDFSGDCPGLGGVPSRCFIRNEGKILSPIWVDDSTLIVASEGQLNLSVSFDTDSSFASGAVDKTKSTSTVGSPEKGPNFTGVWKIQCQKDSLGLNADCPSSGSVFLANGGVGMTSIWESKESYERCGANDNRPTFNLVFGGDEKNTYRLEYGSQASLFENIDGIFGAFLDKAPTNLTSAIETFATAQKTKIEASWLSLEASKKPTGFAAPQIPTEEIKEMILADLISTSAVDLSKVPEICPTLVEKSQAVLAAHLSFPLGIELLCSLSAVDAAEAIAWLKKTDAASCTPLVQKTRVWDAESQGFLAKTYCPGSGQGGACVDSAGSYLGRVKGRLAVTKALGSGDSFSLESLGLESFPTVRPSAGAEDCNNANWFSLTGKKLSETEMQGTLVSLHVDNCRGLGRVRDLDSFLLDFAGPKNFSKGFTGSLKFTAK